MFPATVIIAAAPDGFAGTVKLDPSELSPVLTSALVADGLHAIIGDADGDHRLWFLPGTEPVGAAVLLPVDGNFVLQLHSLQRLHRWLIGQRSGPLSRAQQLSAFQRYRLVLMLRALDGLGSGASRREVASVLFSRNVRTLPAVEWRNTSERRHLARVVSTAREFVNGGYLRLLQGKPPRGHLGHRP